MSFGTFARKVRDPALRYGLRVSALRSCVQLYRPIGFHATLSFLEALAGPFQRDEAALLRALDALISSRTAWQTAVQEYAAVRREAKQLGRRSPHPGDPNPNVPGYWYGARKQGALHALRFWHRRGRYVALLLPPDPVASDLNRCVTACLESRW